jgi:L-alanine-DL-glutamate epimerase-like enolase superfamily enzyme
VKITQVEALQLRLPHVQEIFDGTQDVLVVRVTTDEGLVGHGEVVSASAIAKAVIEAPRSAPRRHGLAQALIGADPLDPIKCWQAMYEASRWYGRQGVALHAMSGIDQALWDIVGQSAGKPLAEIWGKKRPRVRAYASALFPRTKGEASAMTKRFMDMGFSAVKFGYGSFGTDPRHDDDLVGAICNVAGDRAEVMVDAGRVWSADEALRRVPALFAQHNIVWLEEPLHEDDIDGYTRLCAAVEGRIAAGETESTVESFRRLLQSGVRVLQPDVGRAGSLPICREASKIASDAGAWCVAHCFGTGINLAASLHWMASVDDAQYIEYPITPSPLRDTVVRNPPRQIDGWVSVPDGPGLGIEIDGDVLERYAYSYAVSR